MSHLRPRLPVLSALGHLPIFSLSAASAHGLRTRPTPALRPWRTAAPNRRRLAIGGLLLASFLEVCGCNPVEDCDQLRDGQIFSTREALLERCAHCFTANQFATLVNGLKHAEDAGVADALESGKTAQEALEDGAGLAFYDPTEPSADSLSHALPPVRDPLSAETLSWPIPESVFFVYKTVRGGDTSAHRIATATAFVLSVPDRTHKRFVRFLVTARHVVDPEWAHCAAKNPASIEIRLNKRSGGVGYETIPLGAGSARRFVTPDDGTSDLAVILLDRLLIPNLDAYKFIDLPFRLLPTEAELQTMRTDQKVMTAGLPARLPLEFRTYPISDTGVLSKMPAQPVEIGCGTNSRSNPLVNPLHVWFISAPVPQGVSGAPVYTAMARDLDSTQTPVLVGIQSVAWPEKGVAGITPAAALGDLVMTALGRSRPEMDLYRGPPP